MVFGLSDMVVLFTEKAETAREAGLWEENQEFSFRYKMPIGYLRGNVK